MQIANPLYDVVFKYLLDDNRIAKKLLGLILDKEIETLELQPTENRMDLKDRSRPISVFLLDFAATIVTPSGERQRVTIELQKAKVAAEVMRFRRYLATQYATKSDNEPAPLPIYTIYILGHSLDDITCPVLDIRREYIDRAEKRVLTERCAFVEALTHDSVLIQVGRLKNHRRTLLENVLAVFDGARSKKHLLDFDETAYPDEYAEVIRRLQKAIAEPVVRETMNIEDELLQELLDLEQRAENAETLLLEERRKAEEERQKAEEADRKATEERQKAEEERQKAEEERQKAEALQKELEELKKRFENS